MIDIASRNKLAEQNRTKVLLEGIKSAITGSLKEKEQDPKQLKDIINGVGTSVANAIAAKTTTPEDGYTINFKVQREEDQKELDALEKIDVSVKSETTLLEKIGNAFAVVNSTIKGIKLDLPKIFNIQGKVQVQNALRINNLSELEKYFKSLESNIKILAQASSMAPAPQIKMPEFPKIEIPKVDNSKIEELLGDLVEKINSTKETKFPKVMEISNFPRQLTPQPVTNININGLQGFAKTTAVTVTTSLTPLPLYGVLNNRRSMLLYNNGSVTIYIGGSDVTSSNGLPIPASTYSPPIDAGVNMVIYGVTASSSSDCRVLEVSSNQTNSKTQ